MTEELYNKIDEFQNETDWSKYPTYEHALEEFIKGIVAEETKELNKKLSQAETDYDKMFWQKNEIISNLQEQIEKMTGLLEKWYNQHSDKTYTKTFYDELIKATEAFLWNDVCVK